jgi:hypothetical protein
MAEPIIPSKAKLFIGMIFHSNEIARSAEKTLTKKFGEIDYRSKSIPFTHTGYYHEMGASQFKVFLSFRKLIRREKIVGIKLFTNRLEKRFSENGKRRINIDPGYLTLSNVYLASCKEFFHRAYLNRGIYLENEYRYVGKRYLPWEWTYPDYQKQDYQFFFHEMRKLYINQLK